MNTILPTFKENELAVEGKLLKISALLVMQTKKQIPGLIQEIRTAMINFIATPRLESWVRDSNGWVSDESIEWVLELN